MLKVHTFLKNLSRALLGDTAGNVAVLFAAAALIDFEVSWSSQGRASPARS